MLKRTLLPLLALLLAAPLLAAEKTVALDWVGCGITKKAFMAELAKAYERRTGIHIVIEGGGATKGIRRVADRTVPMGGSCRPKILGAPEEIRARMNPVAWDALAVIVHPDNPVSDITLDQLRKVYEGKITNWKALGGPDKPIDLLIRRGKLSGVGRTLRQLVFNDFDKEFASDHVYKSSGPLEKAVETDPWALAVTGVSSARKRKVKLLSLNGKQPDYEHIRSGEYLLYRPLYITSNPAHPQYREVKRFINFAHSREGRAIIRAAGAVPYLDALNLIRKQREQWQEARELVRR
ncbi:MAG TPA: phosphate ABC transporter substrate-binding protein [Gammaproteobacteria bacterium]|nr:phosphate ABC transporter substrate-binding protein [Gammaproteobacteria bacterium]